MYYASIGLIALMIHLVINYNVLIRPSRSVTLPAHRTYRNFLLSVMVYYITDVLWEFLVALLLIKTVFVETTIYFAVMAIAVFLWTQYVIEYINVKRKFLTVLKYTGWLFLIFQLVVLTLNFFFRIAFWFDSDGTYHTGTARALNMLFQLLIFIASAIYMTLFTMKSHGKIKKRYRTIALFCLVMTIFVFLQELYPLLPFYSIGYMFGTCLIHTFVFEDEKKSRQEELEGLLKVAEIQEQELGSARQMVVTDPLTGVKNKTAYIEDVGGIENRIEGNILNDFALVVFDLNGLKYVNDTKGHDKGDSLIKEAGQIISRHFSNSPIYRIGGDEFVAFLMGEDYHNRSKIMENFNRQIEKNRSDGSVVIASGLADFDPKKFSSFLRLFELADKRMYERKNALKAKE